MGRLGGEHPLLGVRDCGRTQQLGTLNLVGLNHLGRQRLRLRQRRGAREKAGAAGASALADATAFAASCAFRH